MNRDEILADYTALRRTSVAINGLLAHTLRPGDIKTAAGQLGILHGKQIELETDDELSVVIDHAFMTSTTMG
ncbi:hypothetical protein BH09PLA1_BH09PLA1_14960 [soil metagenome]